MPGTRLHHLADHDQSVWIDFLSRDLVRSGEIARMMREDGVSGVTSNPTIFARALSGGDAYDEQIAVPVFVFLTTWNSAVAVVFAIAALAFVLSTLYWRLGSADPFAGAITRRDGERRNRD